jgi:hypothetical protein
MTTPFFRYQGSETASYVRRMPEALLRAKTAPRTLTELMHRLEDFTRDEAGYRAQYPWATRFVMGYPLPDWQRPLVWTEVQKVRFITSLWLKIDVGSYLVNDAYDGQVVATPAGQVTQARLFSDILLDGQQRLTALEDYFLGKIAVPDMHGTPTYWTDLGKVERRLFGNQAFDRSTVTSWDEKELRTVYDLRTFGGTAHTEDQRALAAP